MAVACVIMQSSWEILKLRSGIWSILCNVVGVVCTTLCQITTLDEFGLYSDYHLIIAAWSTNSSPWHCRGLLFKHAHLHGWNCITGVIEISVLFTSCSHNHCDSHNIILYNTVWTMLAKERGINYSMYAIQINKIDLLNAWVSTLVWYSAIFVCNAT